MTDVRRFDFLEKVVRDERRRLDDFISTMLARFGAHAHISVFGTATAVQAFTDAYVTTTSTVYTTLSGNPGVAFVAPPSGKVVIHISSALVGEAAGIGAAASFRVGTGSTIGSGTEVLAAADGHRIACPSSDSQEAGRTTLITGLTSGSSYNVQVRYKRQGASSAGGFARRHIAVWPTP